MNNSIAKRPSDIAACVAGFLKSGDLEGITSMFHPECQIHFPPGESPKIGLEGARKSFIDFIKFKPVLRSTIKNEVINGDTALLQAEWELIDSLGNQLAEGSSIEVAKKLDNGGWVYFIDCPNGAPKI